MPRRDTSRICRSRDPGKLPCMFVLMTIDTERELDLERSVLAGRNVTRGTLYLRVRKDQRKSGLRMVSSENVEGDQP